MACRRGRVVLIVAATSGKALWYLTRGTGLVAMLLLTAGLVLGITEAVRWAGPRWPRFVTAGLHKNVSLLAIAFLAAHIVTSVVDGFVPIRWIDAVVPFAGSYRPIWLGLGAVAFDLMIALVATSLLRRRLGYRAWRAVHWAAYACWPIAFVHGLGIGSDTGFGWDLAINMSCLGAVIAAILWRAARSPVMAESRV
jgi:sulfoxide reductase heme-binding subunit YedZ